MKVHSKIKKQSLSTKQERELLFSVCVGPEEVLFQLLVLELAPLPLWDPLPQLLLKSCSCQLQSLLHTWDQSHPEHSEGEHDVSAVVNWKAGIRLIRLLVYRVVARHTALVNWNALLAIFFDCLLLLSDRLHDWFLYYHIWTMPSWGIKPLCLSRLDYRNMKVHKISNLYVVSSNGTIIVVFLSSLGSLNVFSSFLLGFFQGGSKVPQVLKCCLQLMRLTTIHNI